MKAGVSLVRKPVRFICIFLGSGVGCDSSSSNPIAYSTTTSSSMPTSSTIFFATQGRIIVTFTLRISTLLSNSGGNFIDLRSFVSLSENRLSCSADVPLKNPASAMCVGGTVIGWLVEL